ncbi:MAG TPA: hypothetical protein VLF91_04875 [Candidatus Saccharimonadales bacterium]|nr:hypothetical protein [Candidatus Saccharimonadales bacterium]
MSAVEVHDWVKLSLTDRQRRVGAFYASNDPQAQHDFLGLVRAPRGYGVYASIGPNYQYAIFGRDSIAVAEDLLHTQPTLAKEIIVLLAHLQGREFNMQSEEEQGKIHHEYRSLHFNGHQASKVARTVLEKIGSQWGGSREELLYYGSYDATPLFIRLVDNYCRNYGDELLDMQILGGDGVHRKLGSVVREAAAWLAAKITSSPWGLFEFKRLNPGGLMYQAWEDSNVAYLHLDGTTANADGGIAAVELQGYAYDALNAAAELVAADETEAAAWRQLANTVLDTALDKLWMPHEKYFCMGLDRSESGAERRVATFTANPALLLETDFFSRIPHQVAWPYIEGIVRQLFSQEFLTAAGLRVRARKHAKLVSFADYHGSLVTWPKQTHRIADGLKKHGFYTLAALLENCVLHAVAQAGEFYEFFFVDAHNHPKYHYRQENPDEPTFHDFGAANLPEPGQAWTISAVLNMVNARYNSGPLLPVNESVRHLEKDILSQKHVAAIAEACGLHL